MSQLPTGELEAYLHTCAHAARQALTAVGRDQDELLNVLGRFERTVNAASVRVDRATSEQVRKATDEFRTAYDALRSKLDGLVERTAAGLSQAYADLDKDSDFVTLMLFGRTKAGKSTTMEALTRGNGATMGVGRQNTTREVRAYFFPAHPDGGPKGPALRIVDTPGIEGFAGEDLAAMAEDFVERSDHILFLLTDDKATAGELEQFGLIRTQGKSVTVLLNVKAVDEDLDLLLSTPGSIFKTEELDGHVRRITGYLMEHFGMVGPRVLPFHARAAWFAQSTAELPAGIQDRQLLLQRSRLPDVEARIAEFIRGEALPARLRAPRDLLNGYIWPLKDQLRPFAGEFRAMIADLDQLVRCSETGVARARKQSEARLPALRLRFQATSDDIAGIVDAVVAARGQGDDLDQEWQSLLLRHGVIDATRWFVESGQRDFESEVTEEVRAARIDYEFARANDMDSLLNEYHDADEAVRRNKYLRAGLRTGAGTGVAALATWAIFNWWNPTGWVAAAAAAGSALIGMGAETLARKGTDKWTRASRRDLLQKRTDIIATLERRLWADQSAVETKCTDWLDETTAAYLEAVRQIIRPIHASAESLWKGTLACLRELDAISSRINSGLVHDLLARISPECGESTVLVRSIAREPGCCTKILVAAVDGSGLNAIGACVGPRGERVRRLRDALGGEPVHFVDAHAAVETRILQALGIKQRELTTVILDEQEHRQVACVRLAQSELVRRAIGPHGANVRLVRELLGIHITVEGGSR